MINIVISIIAFFSGVFMSLSLLLDKITHTIGKHVNDDIHETSTKKNNRKMKK